MIKSDAWLSPRRAAPWRGRCYTCHGLFRDDGCGGPVLPRNSVPVWGIV